MVHCPAPAPAAPAAPPAAPSPPAALSPAAAAAGTVMTAGLAQQGEEAFRFSQHAVIWEVC